ncbi:unnamed protein product [Paramecium primaurelia]|uniref:Uncharacterized protein n=1 Tax=Paramecium primaurelia TaxID=5886 RepID=A0A8S1NVW4_PARPR|nr:unnamed protein product [Paramecium primaurelia]
MCPEGKKLYSSSENKKFSFGIIQKSTQIKKLHGHSEIIKYLSISSNGDYIAILYDLGLQKKQKLEQIKQSKTIKDLLGNSSIGKQRQINFADFRLLEKTKKRCLKLKQKKCKQLFSQSLLCQQQGVLILLQQYGILEKIFPKQQEWFINFLNQLHVQLFQVMEHF